MSNPLVSIILPTYNGSQFLEQSLRSCLLQTYSNFELIIVDDASTDKTPDIISEVVKLDPRIKLITNSINKKLPGALNVGFGQARGDYLTWTSDDNCYRPEALATMVNYLQSDSGVDIVYCDYTAIDENGKTLEKVIVNNPEHLWNGNCIGACFLYRRALHEKLGGYDENLFLAEDYDFWLRASLFFKLQPLHEDLYLYRRHTGSLTQKERKQDISLATERTLAQCVSRIPKTELRVQAYLKLCRMAETRRDSGTKRRYVLKAIVASPGYMLKNERKLLAFVMLGEKVSDFLYNNYMKLKRSLC